MNKKISTFWAIFIIAVLAVIVGGISFYQYFPKRPLWIPETAPIKKYLEPTDGNLKNEYGDLVMTPGNKYTVIGVLLSSCFKKDESGEIKMSGCGGLFSISDFEVCEWNSYIYSFKEVGRYPNCIGFSVENLSKIEELLRPYYLGEKVIITVNAKSTKYGSKDENCDLSKIGCERDIMVYDLENINKLENELMFKLNWQYFENKKYGFKIRYPKNWKIDWDNSRDFDFLQLVNNDKTSQKITISKISGPPPETMDVEKIKDRIIFIDNYKTNWELFRGIFDNNKNQYYIRVFVNQKNTIFQSDFDNNDLEEISSVFDKIINTFEFID